MSTRTVNFSPPPFNPPRPINMVAPAANAHTENVPAVVATGAPLTAKQKWHLIVDFTNKHFETPSSSTSITPIHNRYEKVFTLIRKIGGCTQLTFEQRFNALKTAIQKETSPQLLINENEGDRGPAKTQFNVPRYIEKIVLTENITSAPIDDITLIKRIGYVAMAIFGSVAFAAIFVVSHAIAGALFLLFGAVCIADCIHAKVRSRG